MKLPGWQRKATEKAIIKYAGMPVLQAWYDALDLELVIARIPNQQQKRYFTKKLDKAKAQSDHEKEFAKLDLSDRRLTAHRRPATTHCTLRGI